MPTHHPESPIGTIWTCHQCSIPQQSNPINLSNIGGIGHLCIIPLYQSKTLKMPKLHKRTSQLNIVINTAASPLTENITTMQLGETTLQYFQFMYHRNWTIYTEHCHYAKYGHYPEWGATINPASLKQYNLCVFVLLLLLFAFTIKFQSFHPLMPLSFF